MVRDPFRRDKDSWLVLCDTWLPNGNPHPDNTRFVAMKIFAQKQVIESKPWFGLEQEFFIRKSIKGYPLGMDKQLYCEISKGGYTRSILLWGGKRKLPRERIYG